MNRNRGCRIICSIMGAVLLSGTMQTFAAEYEVTQNSDYSVKSYAPLDIYDKAASYLDMMQLLPDAQMDENITKGHAVNAIIKSRGCEELAMQYPDTYSYDEKMAAAAHTMGILSGSTPAEWELESEVTLEQCAKMLVAALGYGSIITDPNAYPQPYVAKANDLKILRYGVNGSDGKVSTGDFIAMLYQTMQCELVEISSLSGNKPSYDFGSGCLLEELYLDSKGWVKSEGIVRADYYSSVIGGEKCDYSRILIDEEYYDCESEACKGLVGFSVQYVYTDPDKTGMMQVMGIIPDSNNTVYTLRRSKDTEYKNGVLTYYKNGSNKEKINFSENVVYVYNNCLYSPYTIEDIDLTEVNLRLIDNDDDKECDIVFMSQSESMIINFVRDEKIYIKSGNLYSKKIIDLSETDDMTLIMHDLDGNMITLDDINEGSAISVTASHDLSYMEIIILGDEFEGTVSGYNIDEETITIDGVVYASKIDINALDIGKTYKFRVNENNEIFYVGSLVSDCTYIINKYWDETEENTIIKVYDSINGVQKFNFAQRVNIDGMSYKRGRDAYNALTIKTLANFTFNSEGEVKKIEYLEQYGESALRQYRIHAQGFNDVNEGLSTPFRFDENTVFFYVPQSGATDDFGIYVPLKNEDDYITQGFEYDEDTGCVRAVVVTVDTDKRTDNYLTHNSDVGIVKSVKVCMAPDEQAAYEIAVYHEGEEFTYYSDHYDDVFNVCAKLKRGDVIRFISNYNNEIVRISKIISLSEAEESFIDGRDSVDEQMYGQVITLSKNVMTNFEEYLCHEMTVSASGGYNDLVSMRLFADLDNPYDSKCEFSDYYCYDKRTNEVTPASIEDIISYEEAGDGATKVFVQRSKSEVQFVVIVEE